jgi:hypothetical protein
LFNCAISVSVSIVALVNIAAVCTICSISRCVGACLSGDRSLELVVRRQ